MIHGRDGVKAVEGVCGPGRAPANTQRKMSRLHRNLIVRGYDKCSLHQVFTLCTRYGDIGHPRKTTHALDYSFKRTGVFFLERTLIRGLHCRPVIYCRNLSCIARIAEARHSTMLFVEHVRPLLRLFYSS